MLKKKSPLAILAALVIGVAAVTLAVYNRFSLGDGLCFLKFDGCGSSVVTQQTIQTQSSVTLQTQTQETLSPQLIDLQSKNLARMVDGCLAGRNCISSIDDPQFVSAKSAKHVTSEDLVIGVEIDGQQRAYPLSILNWHEVVNDTIGKVPVVVTYSPLSHTAVAFVRSFDDFPVEFGVSGKLINNDLVLFDRVNDSLWLQMTGQALAGPRTGEVLKRVSSSVTTWREWVDFYPKTKVLTLDVVELKETVVYPYDDYFTSPQIFFPVEYEDNRLQPKTVVYGIQIGNKEKVYPLTELQKTFANSKTLDDTFNGVSLRLMFDHGILKVDDVLAQKEIPSQEAFFFAWAAFHPNSEIFKAVLPRQINS